MLPIKNRFFSSCLLLLFGLIGPGAGAAEVPQPGPMDIVSPVMAERGMVVADEPLAATEALRVLREGGNAVDAAVTLGLTLAVTEPSAGNIGGGGFMLIYLAETGRVVALDYREKAPAKARRDMFLNENGKPDPELSRFSHLAVGVPGTLAGLALALEKYGDLKLKEALAPAIRLAKDGFPMSQALHETLRRYALNLRRWPSSREVFFKPDGRFYQPGEIWKQPDLANTLTLIAEQGTGAFYTGPVAELIVEQMRANDGLITHQDLAGYRPVLREPVTGDYRGYRIFSMPPPSSGGAHIVQMLNMLEGDDLGKLGHNSAASIHLMAQAMQRAYADRSKYLGDPDFHPVPLAGLTDKQYAQKLREQFDPERAIPSSEIAPGQPPVHESESTTHYVVADQFGNVVSNTYTLNFGFGSGIVVKGAGFLLNNEMDDFSAKPGTPNAYGLIGGEANAVEPGKRMLSSMSPTLVLKDGKPVLATGSPGGSRIITTTLQVMINVLDHGMNLQEAVNAPRVHHQWLPDELRCEQGISPDTLALLRQKGHRVSVQSTMGAAASLLLDRKTGRLHGAADPRRTGGVALGW